MSSLTGAGPGAIGDVLRAADLLGVLFNSMLGGIIARGERLDPVGYFALAVLSALGGGLLRDTLMQRGTPVALTDAAYLTTAAVGAALVYLIPIGKRLWNTLFPVADAIALGAWSAAGAGKALGAGFGWFPAILLGVITAVGGGMMRDVVLRRVPSVFGGNTLYATPAMLASGVMVLLWRTGHETWASVVTLVVGASLVLLAQRFELVLPYGQDVSLAKAIRRLPRTGWRARRGSRRSD